MMAEDDYLADELTMMRGTLVHARSLAQKVELQMARLTANPSAEKPHPTVLIVEDDRTTRLVMSEWLTRKGFSVLQAATGGEAARHLDHPPRAIDAAVLDIGLPDVNGAELCEVIHEFHPSLPVVICSALATPEDISRVQGVGVRRFLTKPVEPAEFVSAVEEALP